VSLLGSVFLSSLLLLLVLSAEAHEVTEEGIELSEVTIAAEPPVAASSQEFIPDKEILLQPQGRPAQVLRLIPGFIAPTGNLNTTAACALIVFITYHVIGARKVGVIPYLKHFAGPILGAELFPNKVVDVAFKVILVPLFFVIEIFSHLARPLSLALRLFGNMAGGHILLAVMFLLTLGMVSWAFSGS